MNVYVNGEERTIADGLSIARLLRELAAPERGVAVAKNGRVVRRAEFENELVTEGDRIEIIKAVAGG